MSAWGDTVEMTVWVPPHLSYTGEGRYKAVGIDSCIAPIIRALNEGGVLTVASCCGHGKQPGRISLADGRELFVAPDFATATAVSKAFPPINEEPA